MANPEKVDTAAIMADIQEMLGFLVQKADSQQAQNAVSLLVGLHNNIETITKAIPIDSGEALRAPVVLAPLQAQTQPQEAQAPTQPAQQQAVPQPYQASVEQAGQPQAIRQDAPRTEQQQRDDSAKFAAIMSELSEVMGKVEAISDAIANLRIPPAPKQGLA